VKSLVSLLSVLRERESLLVQTLKIQIKAKALGHRKNC